MDSKQPIITVITVVYNGESLLEGTIQSIIKQNYESIEYIVVDGQSTDGTLEIIKKYIPHIDKWISEPDRGIYDAMNKALKLATGDFVLFMNCGDRFFSPETLKNVMQHYTPQTDVLYGETMLVDDQRNHLGTRSDLTTQKLPHKLNWRSLRFGQVVSHQAFIARRTIAPFYVDDNIAADIDWMIKILKKSRSSVHTGEIIAEFLTGGISKANHRTSLVDRYKILREHFGMLPNLIHHVRILLRAVGFKISRTGKRSY